MKLIVGLGNPTKQYEITRHNAGFIILDEIQKVFSFTDFQINNKFEAEISEGKIQGEKIILIKPQTFMNNSGRALKKVMDFYKILLADIFVIHDDLDIKLGEYKISEDSSSAGHNGVQHIIETFGVQKFKRIRIGIEGSEKKKERVMTGSDFVLQNFSVEELAEIKAIAEKIAQEIL